VTIQYQPQGYGQAVESAAIGAGQAQAAMKTLEMAQEMADRDRERRFKIEMANIADQSALELEKRRRLWEIEKMEITSRTDFAEEERTRQKKKQEYQLKVEAIEKAGRDGTLTTEEVQTQKKLLFMEDLGTGKYELQGMKAETSAELQAQREEGLMTQKNQWPIAKEGFLFLIPSALLTLFLVLMGWKILTLLGILLTLFIAFFFRNPKRKIPSHQNIILSPADGRIIHLGECDEDRFLKERVLKVSIFMSVLDVHINRAPVSGKVLEKSYYPGQFFVANAEKSSLLNEQNAFILETEDRLKILLIQIAGFVARRIVCYAKAGDTLRMGEIFGMIRFGSRIDLYLPKEVRPNIRVGQHVKGGESIIGYQ